MIHDELKPILEIVRRKALEMKEVDLTFDTLNRLPEINMHLLRSHVETPDELVEKLLEHELGKFATFVDEINPENHNSIDAMLMVSKKIAENFHELFPSVSPQLKVLYPQAYMKQFERRIQFISDKIRRNLNHGIQQGLYRSDLSSELIARLYISRLIDIHNPELFPAETFSFPKLFNQMFESLIRSIATPKGLEYFEHRKKHYSL